MKNIVLGNFKIENAVNKEDIIEIEGFACHFGKKNLNNEIVNAQSFDTFFKMYENKELVPKLNYNHDNNYIIGGINDIISVEEGLYMSAYLNNKVSIVREMIAPNVLDGTLNAFSTEGFIKDGYNGIEENEDGSYYVKDFLLTMVAIVPTPADPSAHFSLKNFIDEYKANKKAEEEKIKEENQVKSKYYLFV